MSDKKVEIDWSFARKVDTELKFDFNPERIYRETLNSRQGMKDLIQTAANAALENLMSWERIAKANGFYFQIITDRGMGKPVPHMEGNEVCFVQAYSVVVKNEEVEERVSVEKRR